MGCNIPSLGVVNQLQIHANPNDCGAIEQRGYELRI